MAECITKIDPNAEAVMPFNDARDCFPGRKNLSVATLHRWRLNGVRGVRLQTILIGARRYVSREAISRFIEAQNRDEQPSLVTTTSQRAKQSASAREALAMAGV